MARYITCLKDAVSPIIWLNCVFCMGVFEIPPNRQRFRLSVIYTVTCTIAYFVILYKGIFIFEKTFSSELILFYCVVIVNILVATISIILFWSKSQKFYILIKKFGLVDDTLEALGIKKNYDKTFYDVLCGVIIWIVCVLLLNIMHIIWSWHHTEYLNNIYITLCLGLPLMINSVVDVTLCALIRCVGSKFRNTNIFISNILSLNDRSILKIHNKPENTPIALVSSHYKNKKDMIIHLVQTLKQVHLELTRIAHDINGSFCLQVLLEMALHFTIITTVCYTLYSVLAGNSGRMGTGNEKVISMITWGLIYSIKITLLNHFCTVASYEAYKTGELIQSFEGSFLDDELREEIRQFTKQIMLNSLHFTAAGFFKINNVLTGSFFATVTTYVVILIQMNTPA